MFSTNFENKVEVILINLKNQCGSKCTWNCVMKEEMNVRRNDVQIDLLRFGCAVDMMPKRNRGDYWIANKRKKKALCAFLRLKFLNKTNFVKVGQCPTFTKFY